MYYQENGKIFIWFTRYPLTEQNKVYIPEAYLVIKDTEEKNAIIIIKKENSFNILVKKEGNLVSQITYKKEPSDIKTKIKLLAKEHSLKDYKVVETVPKEYRWHIKDIIRFSKFEFSRENILRFILSNIAVPLTVIFIGLSIYKIADYKYLEMKKASLEEKLIKLKNENKDIKNKIRVAQEKKEFWENFINKELKYPPAYTVLSVFGEKIFNQMGFIQSINYTKELITAIVGLPKKRKSIIQELLNTGYFKDIKITSTAPDRLSKDYEILNMELYVKELKKIKGSKK